jgi:mono/diheme cytochrome c family protein
MFTRNMGSKVLVHAPAAFVVLLWGVVLLHAQEPETTAPIFTAEQADRGYAIYRTSCQDCHGTTLDNGEFGGPPLKGGYFDGRWKEQNVAALYGLMSATMPLDRPGQLTMQAYADLTAFILSRNGHAPSDRELPIDAAAQMKMKVIK